MAYSIHPNLVVVRKSLEYNSQRCQVDFGIEVIPLFVLYFFNSSRVIY